MKKTENETTKNVYAVSDWSAQSIHAHSESVYSTLPAWETNEETRSYKPLPCHHQSRKFQSKCREYVLPILLDTRWEDRLLLWRRRTNNSWVILLLRWHFCVLMELFTIFQVLVSRRPVLIMKTAWWRSRWSLNWICLHGRSVLYLPSPLWSYFDITASEQSKCSIYRDRSFRLENERIPLAIHSTASWGWRSLHPSDHFNLYVESCPVCIYFRISQDLIS